MALESLTQRKKSNLLETLKGNEMERHGKKRGPKRLTEARKQTGRNWHDRASQICDGLAGDRRKFSLTGLWFKNTRDNDFTND